MVKMVNTMNLFESRGIVVVAVVLEFVYLILCSRYVFWHVGKTAVGEGSGGGVAAPAIWGGGGGVSIWKASLVLHSSDDVPRE